MQIKKLGYCEWSDERLIQLIRSGRAEEILAARGQFVVVADEQSVTTIVTSHHGLQHYYYATCADTVIHGETVLDVCLRLDIPFRWNYRAVGDVLILDHTIGNDTLCLDVQRTPPGSILFFKGGQVRLYLAGSNRDPTDFSVSDLRAKLPTEVMHWWGHANDVLCLTGGLDSRLLLSVLLKCGQRPRALVCGHKESHDVMVARAISRKFSLDLIECEVTAADFLEDAEILVSRTNGLLPVSHWPGVLFSRHLRGARLFLGFNGEAVRSYYDSHGVLSMGRARFPSHGYLARNLWRRRTALPLSEQERASLHPELRVALGEDGWQDRFDRLLPQHLQLGDALDHVFAKVRTPNKSGIDMSAIALHTDWVAPFCSDPWINAAGQAPRIWKLWDSLHHKLIRHFEPQLLKFPTDTPHTFLGKPSVPSREHFFDQRHYHNSELVQYFQSTLTELDELFDVSEWSNWSDTLQTRLFFSLASMGLWRHMLGRIKKCESEFHRYRRTEDLKAQGNRNSLSTLTLGYTESSSWRPLI